MVGEKIPVAGRGAVLGLAMDTHTIRRETRGGGHEGVGIRVLAESIAAVEILGRLPALGQTAILAERLVAVAVGNPVVAVWVEDAREARAAFAVEIRRARC